MIENFKHSSPSMSDCRRTACSSPGSLTEVIVNKAQFVRRRRMELRQLKSPCQIRSEIANEDCRSLFKKVIHEIDSNVEEFEGDKSSGNDAVVAGTSKAKNDEVMEISRSGACLSHGSMSVIGRRREMEDAVTVERSFLTGDSREYDFFGAYDGHGGSRVAHACRDWLHRLLVKAVEEDGGGKVDWTKVMKASFQKMDEEMSRRGAAVATVGSTAVVAVVGEEELMVANCGDSRAVLSRAGQAVALSNDHKPDRPDELGRIEACGGRVLNWNGQRVLGVLATSRSIGDQYLKPFVISEPEVTVNKRIGANEFLILATDGLWDVITNDVACRVTRRSLNGQTKRKSQGTLDERTGEFNRASAAATVLTELAMARESKDNISVIVVELTKPMSNM